MIDIEQLVNTRPVQEPRGAEKRGARLGLFSRRQALGCREQAGRKQFPTEREVHCPGSSEEEETTGDRRIRGWCMFMQIPSFLHSGNTLGGGKDKRTSTSLSLPGRLLQAFTYVI